MRIRRVRFPLPAVLLLSACAGDGSDVPRVRATSQAIVGAPHRLDPKEWETQGRVAEIVAKNPGPAASCAPRCHWQASGC
jgi:outer membrane biogenesis lipoprotein LolB